MKTKYSWTFYNNWKKGTPHSHTFELLTMNWDFRTKYFGITVLNFELMYAETYY